MSLYMLRTFTLPPEEDDLSGSRFPGANQSHKTVKMSRKEENELRNHLLMHAIKQNNIIYIGRKLHHDQKALNQLIHGTTLLCEAAKYKRSNIMKILLLYGANPNKGDEELKTPLHYASIHGHLGITKLLLKHNADTMAEDIYENLPVSLLKTDSHELSMLLLIHLQHTNLNEHETDDKQMRKIKKIQCAIFETAILNGFVFPLQFLKVNGFPSSTNDVMADWALFIKGISNNELSFQKMILNMLFEHGINSNTHTDQNGDTMLILACKTGNIAAVTYLINDHNFRTDIKNKNNDTILHICAKHGYQDIMNTILERGFGFLFEQNLQGNTILHEATKNKNFYCAQVIIDEVISFAPYKFIDLIITEDNESNTALTIACQSQDWVIASLILERLVNTITDGFTDSKSGLQTLNQMIHQCRFAQATNKILIQTLTSILKKHKLGLKFLCMIKNDVAAMEFYVGESDKNNSKANYDNDEELERTNNKAKLQCIEIFLEKTYFQDRNSLVESLSEVLENKAYDIAELMLQLNLTRNGIFEEDKTDLQTLKELLKLNFNHEIIYNYMLYKSKANPSTTSQLFKYTLLFYKRELTGFEFFEVIKNYWLNAYIGNLAFLGEVLGSFDRCIVYGETSSILHQSLKESESLDFLKFLVTNGAPINAKNRQGKTILHVAIRKCNSELIQLLIQNGADVDIKDRKGRSCFHYAIRQRMIKYVLPAIVEMDERKHQHSTSGKNEKSRLLARAVNINTQDISRKTCLHTAIYKKDTSTCILLIKAGIDVFLTNKYGQTAIQLAFEHKEYDILNLILETLPTIPLPSSFSSLSLLIKFKQEIIGFAASSKHLSVDKLQYTKSILTSTEMFINHCDRSGEIPLNWAVQTKNIEVAELLLQHNALPNATGKHSMTPIDYAIKNHDINILDCLLQYNSNLESINDRKDTIFHLAIRHNSITTLQHILDKHLFADGLDKKNFKGETPLSIALKNENRDAIFLLLTHGASVNTSAINYKFVDYKLVRMINYLRFQSEDVNRQNIWSEYECPVCFDIPEEVYTCSRGHFICNHCKARLKPLICPICRISLSLNCRRNTERESEIKESMIKFIQGKNLD